jgi:hypothetical protein
LIDATNAKDSEPFIEAPNTAQNAIFLGYIIIQGGGSGTPPRDLLNASEATILQGGLFRNIGGIGSSGTSPIATTFASLSDVSVASRTNGDLPIYNGSQWANGKVLTGNYSINGGLTVTGSIIGTASLANTASYINPLNQNIIITGSLRGQVNALSIASTTASLNLSTNNFFTLTLVNGANTHISASNIQPGQTVNIRITQGSAGTGTLSFNSAIKQSSGSLYTGSMIANAVDVVSLIAFDSSSAYISYINNFV